MYLDYWSEQQRLADEEAGHQGSLEHEAWCKKVTNYFEWREQLSYDEDDGLARYATEDAERRFEWNITDADDERWKLSKEQATLDLPF
jgi:hypothetical protein